MTGSSFIDDRWIEEIYPLTPLQQGMLFHTLQSEHAGPYIEQFVFELHGHVDSAHLRSAWNEVVRRHPALRTAFVWEGLDEPVQVVISLAPALLQEFDTSDDNSAEIDERIARYLSEDRVRGFDLTEAPLMRVALFRNATASVLIWTIHHLVLDGWSFPVVLREVVTSYRALLAGSVPDLPQATPFRTFVEWLGSRNKPEAERYWRHRLHEFSTHAALKLYPGLPADRRGAARNGVARHDFSFGLSESIRASAAAASVTLGTWFQAAWALTLARHTGDSAVSFGLTVAGRPPELPGVDGIVGPFINTVPQCLRINFDQHLRPWLRELQKDHLEREPFQHVGLVQIQGWTKVPAGESLFETILVFENYPNERPVFNLDSGTTIELREVLEDTGYPLTLLILPKESIRIQLLYDTTDFTDEAIEALMGRLESLLQSMVDGLDSSLESLSSVSETERQCLTVEWNRTEWRLPLTPVHEAFAQQAIRTPNRVAVESHTESCTYAELNARAEDLAALIAGRGRGPEVVVALMQHRSIQLLVSMLAVLKAGAAYVMLDPGHPNARLDFLLENSRATLVITESSLLGRFRETLPTLVLDAEVPFTTQPSPPARVTPSSLCYITYTSGSTGRPKGIEMTHGAVANLIYWQLQSTSVPGEAKTFGYASLSFDVSFQEIFATWCAGGTLVLVDEHDRADFERLCHVAADRGVQRWFLPAVALQQVAAAAGRIDVRLPSLREIVSGSEPLHMTRDLRSLLAHNPFCRLENQYGPSECHVVTSHVISEEPDRIPEAPPIGRPIANIRVFILDDHLRLAPVGVAGLIYLAGAGVARGYVGLPGTTGARFLPCPFPNHPGERMYDTGDRARYLADGSIELLGRLDNQVKLRGYRIELGEVEAVLRNQAGVRNAVVLLREVADEQRLVGYVRLSEASESHDVQITSIMDSLREVLPEYMLPWALVPVDAFPLTVNHKIDRDALPTPSSPVPQAAEGRSPSTRPAARFIETIWSEVLGVPSVDPDSDFFRLGGHSLAAVRVIGRVRMVFALAIGVGEIFSLRTPRRLLDRIDAELGSPEVADALAEKHL